MRGLGGSRRDCEFRRFREKIEGLSRLDARPILAEVSGDVELVSYIVYFGATGGLI